MLLFSLHCMDNQDTSVSNHRPTQILTQDISRVLVRFSMMSRIFLGFKIPLRLRAVEPLIRRRMILSVFGITPPRDLLRTGILTLMIKIPVQLMKSLVSDLSALRLPRSVLMRNIRISYSQILFSSQNLAIRKFWT